MDDVTKHRLLLCVKAMKRPALKSAVVTGVSLLGLSVFYVNAQLVSLNPFNGQLIESFDQFTAGTTTAPIVIMNGAATVQTAAKVSFDQPLVINFQLGDSSANAPGQCAVPADGLNLLGFEKDPTAIAIHGIVMNVMFTNTVNAFGGYWGAGTLGNSAAIIFTFFDAADQPIGAPQSILYQRLSGDGVLEWHGWYSTTPFKRVNVTATNSGSTLVGDSFRAGFRPIITSVSWGNTGEFLFSGNGVTGLVFAVQVNTNLNTTNWLTIGSAITDTNGISHFADTNAGTIPQRFYRLVSP
jgi:hypothetical protein